MFKCANCGHIFDDGEAKVTREYHDEIPGGFYEEFTSCPVCGGDYEETYHCEKCGGEFLWSELRGAYYCEDCLKDALTVDSFLEFAKYADGNSGESEVHTVEHFMMVWVYGVSDKSFSRSSKEFRELMTEKFNQKAETEKGDFLKQIWMYLEDYKQLDIFAEWLYDKEKEVGK